MTKPRTTFASLAFGLQLGFVICTVLSLIIIQLMPSPKDTDFLLLGLASAALTLVFSIYVYCVGFKNRGIWGIGIATVVFTYLLAFPWVIA